MKKLLIVVALVMFTLAGTSFAGEPEEKTNQIQPNLQLLDDKELDQIQAKGFIDAFLWKQVLKLPVTIPKVVSKQAIKKIERGKQTCAWWYTLADPFCALPAQ